MTILLNADSIRGESGISGYQGWVPVSRCEFGAAAKVRYAATDEDRVIFSDVLIERVADASSPFFLLNLYNRKYDETFKLVFLRSSDDGPVEYLRIELGLCGVSGIKVVAGEGRPLEQLTLAFRTYLATVHRLGDELTGSPVSAAHDMRAKR